MCSPDDVGFDFEHWEIALDYFKDNKGKMKALEKSGAKYINPVQYSKAEL